MLYMISFAKETPIKTCIMSLAWEPTVCVRAVMYVSLDSLAESAHN